MCRRWCSWQWLPRDSCTSSSGKAGLADRDGGINPPPSKGEDGGGINGVPFGRSSLSTLGPPSCKAALRGYLRTNKLRSNPSPSPSLQGRGTAVKTLIKNAQVVLPDGVA